MSVTSGTGGAHVHEATRTGTPILVVDDEPKTLLVSQDILRLAGYEVDTACDGREALDKFQPGRHAAVITDIRMPGMTGIELAERLRSRDEGVPILIVTGYATVETATRAVSAGAVEYLFKPIDFDRLKSSLARAIERWRLTEENKRLVRELVEANRRLEQLSSELERQVRSKTRALGLNRDLLENVVTAIPTGLAVLRADGSIVSDNAAFSRLGPAGKELIQHLHADVEASAHGGSPVRGRDVVVRDPEATPGGGRGADRAFRVSLVPLAGGRALLAADDVTEAERIEEELVQVEKLVSLGTLAGGIVHDLASPITAILGTAELIMEDLPLDKRGELEAIYTAAGYMRDVCGNLTEFSRRARRHEAFAVQVGDVVQKAVSFARYGKKLLGVTVEVTLASGLPTVAASPSELMQVLLNLVANACDVMVAAAIEDPRLHVRTALEGKMIRIEVADNGPGIPEPLRPRIFQPFFTTKSPGKGTGLGLYTSRKIMKRLGGRLEFATGPGGTTFTMELPAQHSPLASA